MPNFRLTFRMAAARERCAPAPWGRSPRYAQLGMAALFLLAYACLAAGGQIDIPGPADSVKFGTSVTVLPNGNIVVTDPDRMSNVGAVYLYSQNGSLISTLTGNSPSDRVGSGGVKVLGNGHFVVHSPSWKNGSATNSGAVTWGNANSGVTGAVTAANSMVGTNPGDNVGSGGIVALSNGHYVVVSPTWGNGANAAVGAVTWGNGALGTTGHVFTSNSLVGTRAQDRVGLSGATALSNGHYVVASAEWSISDVSGLVGAATWCNGNGPTVATVSVANSLVGSIAFDRVGKGGVTALSNGNYVVASPDWNLGGVADAGAATWGNGSSGSAGAVTAQNSLVGGTLNDRVSASGITALTNGNYVAGSSEWGALDVGAATWGNGTAGSVGAVSAGNSLVGSTQDDRVGGLVRPLTNGNYVVFSNFWNGVAADVGAVTWGSGTTGIFGAVSASNSLVGSTAFDIVGAGGITALSNGNYVVASPNWDNAGSVDVGAVTWSSGTAGITEMVSPVNSLVGTTGGDMVGSVPVTALTNGHYVVGSNLWGISNFGAATWGNGSTGLVGTISPANSLIGTVTDDQVGRSGTRALKNGNYVVLSAFWNLGFLPRVGAASWRSGGAANPDEVSLANSLTGMTSMDVVGSDFATALSDGNYVVVSSLWDNGGVVDAGAISLGRGTGPTAGLVGAANSVRGTVANKGIFMVWGYDAGREQLAVGRPDSNILSLFTLPSDTLFKDSFENPPAAGAAAMR